MDIDIQIKLLAEGNEAAFREVYDLYHQKVYALGYYFTHSPSVAEDITQDIFLKIWDKRRELKEVQNFSSWIKVLVRNHAYNLIAINARERLHRKNQSYDIVVPSLAEAKLEGKERNNIFEKAINNLPDQQKKVFILSRYEGFKIAEIADMLKISPNTVKNHLKAANHSIAKYCSRHIELLFLLLFLK